MADERYNFSQARTRLEEIVTQVRKKDTSLEKSLDLLEEGVRLANVCTELSDHTEWRTVVEEQAAETSSQEAGPDEPDTSVDSEDSGDVAPDEADAAPVDAEDDAPDEPANDVAGAAAGA